jgi:hypothetical protein
MNGVSLETRGGGRSMYVAAAAGAGLRSVTRKVQRCGGVQCPFSVGEQSGKWKVEN